MRLLAGNDSVNASASLLLPSQADNLWARHPKFLLHEGLLKLTAHSFSFVFVLFCLFLLLLLLLFFLLVCLFCSVFFWLFFLFCFLFCFFFCFFLGFFFAAWSKLWTLNPKISWRSPEITLHQSAPFYCLTESYRLPGADNCCAVTNDNVNASKLNMQLF